MGTSIALLVQTFYYASVMVNVHSNGVDRSSIGEHGIAEEAGGKDPCKGRKNYISNQYSVIAFLKI